MILKQIYFLSTLIGISCCLSIHSLHAQQCTNTPWHGIERQLHYKPDGSDFLLVQGKRRFNRALYGTNTAFRVEAGDLPEFALYMPGMAGNLQFAMLAGGKGKWLRDADSIVTRYRPGAMHYTIRDSLLGRGSLAFTVLAQANAEGLVLRIDQKEISAAVNLLVLYGGASGKTFSRGGDIGADPESGFYLLPEYCRDNQITLEQNGFHLTYLGKKKATQTIQGVFSGAPEWRKLDAHQLQTPNRLWNATTKSDWELVGARYHLNETAPIYLTIQRDEGRPDIPVDLKALFDQAEARRKQLAERVVVDTPDPYINTLGGALAVAADAIWESPTYLHGAVAWRMRLNAWRGAYVADPLGWHDRARLHFESYLHSQVLKPDSGAVVPDTARHFARQQEKMGTAVFSSGYISRNPNDNTRPHHYDMNLVFFDQLFNHFQYTGDRAFIKQAWPAIKRHLAWEKRNFDRDGDGLYDAYCAIWASDALQYSGGGVTHTSAYNYCANQIAVQLAMIAGEDPQPYATEAQHIKQAMQTKLWLPNKGWYAEYQDLLGNQLLHESPGLWTIYHALDAQLPNPFEAYQSLRYIDRFIPHIPIAAKGLVDSDYYTLATTNWQPYTWSINNVALAENLQTALAYWQGGRAEEAFQLWKSNLIESMYIGASPGNFQQLSFYDAQRGELYRDFADPIGVAARTLVEGLFGIQPNALEDTLQVKPGFPAAWDHASLTIPNMQVTFERKGLADRYVFKQHFAQLMNLHFCFPARQSKVADIRVNGKAVHWKIQTAAVGQPVVELQLPKSENYEINITWSGKPISKPTYVQEWPVGKSINVNFGQAKPLKLYDPQRIIQDVQFEKGIFQPQAKEANGTFFVQLQQADMYWWQPINVKVNASSLVSTNEQYVPDLAANWDLLNLQPQFNAAIGRIFEQQYLTPRPTSPTLQLPWQGIGNWCYPLVQPHVDDSGLRHLAQTTGKLVLPNGVPFQLSADRSSNILFTSMWDNYPTDTAIPLTGKGKHLYVLMAGTTNPMQSQLVNGIIEVLYTDGELERLPLRNPNNWWPIEQDYEDDGYAFKLPKIRPYRVCLKTGTVYRGGEGTYTAIKGFTDRAVDGGAATVLDLPLNPHKTLKSLRLKAVANDVVIGLMAATVERF